MPFTIHHAHRAVLAAALCLGPGGASAEQSQQETITEALRAAPAGLAMDATVKNWEGQVLRQGSNGWTCYPGPEHMPNSPMCLDAVWAEWAPAWANQEPFETDRVGFAYMLMGDDGTSNIDPYAKKPTADNDWVVEGPHLMVLVPDEEMLEGMSTDPHNGGPYVMWEGTPYVHIMAPVR